MQDIGEFKDGQLVPVPQIFVIYDNRTQYEYELERVGDLVQSSISKHQIIKVTTINADIRYGDN